MNPKVLKSEKEYETALARVAALMNASPDSAEADELELWSILVERQEQEKFPIDHPDPVEAIRFRMEQERLRPKDLEPYLKGRNRVSEVLNRKRPLSLAMMRALHRGFGIPAEVLLRGAG